MRVLDVPLYMQAPKTAYCVPYCMVGIAHYYRIKISKKEMIKVCGTKKIIGSFSNVYTKGIEKIGLKFKRIKFNYAEIKKTIKQGHPVVFAYSENVRNPEASHFSTIIGVYKDKRGIPFFLLNDTYYGRIEVPQYFLDYLWRESRSWARKVICI